MSLTIKKEGITFEQDLGIRFDDLKMNSDWYGLLSFLDTYKKHLINFKWDVETLETKIKMIIVLEKEL